MQLSEESDASSDTHSSCDSGEASCPEPEPIQPPREPSPAPMDVCEDTIKQEEPDIEYECPSSPDVPNDPELDAKVETRFRRTDEDDRNACARCGLIYVMKRPKKQKPLKVC